LLGTFHLDRSRSATVQVYERLREMIVNSVLKPGAVLQRAQLVEYFALSQTPIREALTRLDDERLVEIFPQYQTRVRDIDLDSARQAHFARLSIELEIVHTLAERPNPDIEKTLLAYVSQQRICLKAGDLTGFNTADQAFHKTMYAAAGVPDLWATVRNLSGNLDRLRRLHLPLNNKAHSIIAQHSNIAKAVGAGDQDAAQSAVRAHLSGTLSELNTLRSKYPGYVL
jgi:DNA-binding GntR family transcriptional regulator